MNTLSAPKICTAIDVDFEFTLHVQRNGYRFDVDCEHTLFTLPSAYNRQWEIALCVRLCFDDPETAQKMSPSRRQSFRRYMRAPFALRTASRTSLGFTCFLLIKTFLPSPSAPQHKTKSECDFLARWCGRWKGTCTPTQRHEKTTQGSSCSLPTLLPLAPRTQNVGP